MIKRNNWTTFDQAEQILYDLHILNLRIIVWFISRISILINTNHEEPHHDDRGGGGGEEDQE